MIRRVAAALGCLVLAALTGCATRPTPATTAAAAPRGRPGPVTAYVATMSPYTMTPVRLAPRKLLTPVKLASVPITVAITPDGRTLVTVNRGSVQLIHTADDKVFKTARLRVLPWPAPVVFTPDGTTAYIVNDEWNGTVGPVNTRTGAVGQAIRVGHDPQAMAITPDGKTAYVSSGTADTVTPIRTATNTALRSIRAGQPGGVPARKRS